MKISISLSSPFSANTIPNHLKLRVKKSILKYAPNATALAKVITY
jgi:hypothetical protein